MEVENEVEIFHPYEVEYFHPYEVNVFFIPMIVVFHPYKAR
jgi:hypothetical protein